MLNQVQLIGNLGRDPEIRSTQGGDKVANLSIATSESWKDKNTGEKKERTEWHRVVIWGRLAEVCEKYLQKGSKVFIQGKLQTRKWTDKSGVEKYSTEVVLQGYGGSLQILGGWRGDGQQSAAQDYQAPSGNGSGNAGPGINNDAPDFDDEIPF